MTTRINPRTWTIHDRYYPTMVGNEISAPLTLAPPKYQGFINRDTFRKSQEEKEKLKELKLNSSKKPLVRYMKAAF